MTSVMVMSEILMHRVQRVIMMMVMRQIMKYTRAALRIMGFHFGIITAQ